MIEKRVRKTNIVVTETLRKSDVVFTEHLRRIRQCLQEPILFQEANLQ